MSVRSYILSTWHDRNNVRLVAMGISILGGSYEIIQERKSSHVLCHRKKEDVGRPQGMRLLYNQQGGTKRML